MRGWQIWGALTALALTLMALTAAAAFALTPVGPAATCAGRQATIVGSAGPDSLNGTPGPDVIAGRGGADRIAGGGGDDLICAGAGADTARGGEGADEILGQQGRDKLAGDRGDDRLVGGPGSDRCLGGAGSNALVGCELPAKTIPAPAPVASPAPGGNPARPGIPIDANPPVPPTQITSTPPLTPAFDPGVSDYTVRCDGTPLALSVAAAPGDTVAVDGAPEQSGSFKADVPLEADQEFGFSVDGAGAPRDFHVRCLPSDFPTWEYERLRQPSHEFYMAAPTLLTGQAPPYAVIFDDEGAPVWWYKDTPGPIDAKFLGPDRVAWWTQNETADGYEIRELDGDVTHTASFVGNSTDIHELQQEPNGDYLVTSYRPREHVDLTEFGGGPDDSVIDGVIQEVDDAGNVVWEWSTENHIGLYETGRWWPTALAGTEGADIVHMNAVEPVGDDAVLISLRHTDAVYKIDKASGDVDWKLGGTWTPKSLAVKGDPEGAYPLGGQHDVRLQPDGTITIHDNDTNLPGSPRGVRYAIDEDAKTATLVEEVTDPLVPSSFCCGSARRSDDGSWLFDWGGNSLVTEFDGAGQRTFKLGFGGSAFSYRAVSAPSGVTAEALRAGMDSMHPRP